MMQMIDLAWVKANPEGALAMIERATEARDDARDLAKVAAVGHRHEEQARRRCQAALRVARGYVLQTSRGLAPVGMNIQAGRDLVTIDAALDMPAQQAADRNREEG